MAGEWVETTLDDACEVITDGAHRSPASVENGMPMASVKDLHRWGIDISTARKISLTEFASLEQAGCKPRQGDVLIAKDGATCLETVCEFQQPQEIVLLSSVAILRPSEGTNSTFLRYYLDCEKTKEMLRAGYVSGSAIPRVVLKDFRRAPITLPPLPEQKRIAHVLGTLDDKIELNRRMNATLEAMSRAIFKSWFVDFDPVRQKAAGKQPVGMDAETAALFPNSFEDSELGEVPTGWEYKTLSDIAENVSVTFDFSRQEEVIFINTGDVLNGDFLHSNRSIKNDLPGQAKKTIEHDDILFTEIRPANRRFAFVDFDASDYVVSTKFMVIRSQGAIHPRLLFRTITSETALKEFQMVAESRSGTFPQITFDSVGYFPMIVPPREIQSAYQDFVEPLDRLIKSFKSQSSTLAALRDTLLPKLLSGEIRVPEAEEAIEEAVA